MSRFLEVIEGEAYTKSQYMFHETLMMDFFVGQLINLGYTLQDTTGRVWGRGTKKVIVCLSDDVFTFGTNSTTPVGQELTKDTTVITDNHFLGMPKYPICKVPDSYYGIYSYVPDAMTWNPTKRFNFSVNRFDVQRLFILLELIDQSGGLDELLLQDHVNFNVFVPTGNNSTVDNIRSNFVGVWDKVNKHQEYDYYKAHVEQLAEAVPICNYEFSHSEAHVNAWMNVVIESYTGDTNRTLSEKTFRALVTPAPWTLYACRYTIELLKNLGFDVLDDIVDHSYNKALQSTSEHGIKKIREFIASSIENQRKLQSMDFDKLKTRCTQAAEHNQKLLAEMRKQWPSDLANWLPGVIKQLI